METGKWFNDLVSWCNINNGFLTGLFSFLALIASVTAIVVSIHTARIPYRKRLKLSSSLDTAFYRMPNSNNIKSSTNGISVNSANTGSRNINLSYLGIAVSKPLHGRTKQITKIRDEITGTGIIAPAEVKTELFKTDDLIVALSKLDKRTKLYLFARDSEGKEYFHRLGCAAQMFKNLSER